MTRKLLLSTLGAFTIGLAGLGLGGAEAAGPRVTPNGLCGAENMMASDAMAGVFNTPPTGPMSVNAPQGNTGMFGAVAASACR